MKSALLTTTALLGTVAPVARTIEATGTHYAWTRTFIFERLATEELIALKAGRRTLITTESADRLFASLPRATYRPSRPTLTGVSGLESNPGRRSRERHVEGQPPAT
jgi:hypothetical protein